MNSFSRSLPMMLYRTLDAVMPEFRAIFSEFDLTEPQWRVLRVLWEHDGASVLELARVTLVAAPSLVGVLDRLQQAELIERRPGETDRRHVHVHLRPRGRALERVRPMVEAAYAHLERAHASGVARATRARPPGRRPHGRGAHHAHAGVRKAVAARRTALPAARGRAAGRPMAAGARPPQACGRPRTPRGGNDRERAIACAAPSRRCRRRSADGAAVDEAALGASSSSRSRAARRG
jgi:homoprotocatechuate degradation regulator HpaR